MAYSWTRVKMNRLTPCRFIHTFMYKLSWAPVARGPAESGLPVLPRTGTDPNRPALFKEGTEPNWPALFKEGTLPVPYFPALEARRSTLPAFCQRVHLFHRFFFFFVCAKLSECKDLSPNLVCHNFSKAFYFLLKLILPHFLHLFTVLWIKHRSDPHEGRKGRI